MVATPPIDLVDAYLAEIAKAYGVQWTPRVINQKGDSEEEPKVCFRKFPVANSNGPRA